ncbi:MAG: YdcF family protein [Blautia sp.]|nr:YdcF family protein [Blautia sp.]
MILCTAISLLCIFYYLVIVLYAGITADFAWIWITGGIWFGTYAILLWFGREMALPLINTCKNIFLVLTITGLIGLFGLSLIVRKGMITAPKEKLDYVIVLGAQVKKDRPSKALMKRLQKALEFYKENPDVLLILSGGMGDGEDITEAECMRRYLVQNGVDEKHLILEENSTTTKENLIFSDRITGCAEHKTAIVSNDFHIARSILLAEKLGYLEVTGLPAESDFIMQLHYIIREDFALIKEKLWGNI